MKKQIVKKRYNIIETGKVKVKKKPVWPTYDDIISFSNILIDIFINYKIKVIRVNDFKAYIEIVNQKKLNVEEYYREFEVEISMTEEYANKHNLRHIVPEGHMCIKNDSLHYLFASPDAFSNFKNIIYVLSYNPQ